MDDIKKANFMNVLSIFQKISVEGDGCTIEQVAACAAQLPSSKNITMQQISEITNELMLEGHIYSTIDENTFKATSPLLEPATIEQPIVQVSEPRDGELEDEVEWIEAECIFDPFEYEGVHYCKNGLQQVYKRTRYFMDYVGLYNVTTRKIE